MAQVFLSYSKQDRPAAEQIVAALRAAGLSVWWDEDLTPRVSWNRTIREEIERADAVLVLWTPASIESDWVHSEADFARTANPPKLVQARIGGVRVPLGFDRVQYADLNPNDPAGGAEWRKLLLWLPRSPEKPDPGYISIPDPGRQSQTPSPPPPSPPPPDTPQKNWIVEILGVLGTGIGILIAQYIF